MHLHSSSCLSAAIHVETKIFTFITVSSLPTNFVEEVAKRRYVGACPGAATGKSSRLVLFTSDVARNKLFTSRDQEINNRGADVGRR